MLHYVSVHWLLLHLEFSMSFRSFWSVSDPTQSRRYLLCVCVSVQINWLNGSVGESGPGVAILEYQPPKRGIVHAEDIMQCVCCCSVCVCKCAHCWVWTQDTGSCVSGHHSVPGERLQLPCSWNPSNAAELIFFLNAHKTDRKASC